MKKILYLFLTVSLIFSSCKKEEDEPVVIIPPATINYTISGDVWASQSVTVDGQSVGGVAVFLWTNGDFGIEAYDANGDMTNYEGGPGIGSYTTTSTTITTNSGSGGATTFTVDNMTTADAMTWRMTDDDGSWVVPLVRVGADPDALWK